MPSSLGFANDDPEEAIAAMPHDSQLASRRRQGPSAGYQGLCDPSEVLWTIQWLDAEIWKRIDALPGGVRIGEWTDERSGRQHRGASSVPVMPNASVRRIRQATQYGAIGGNIMHARAAPIRDEDWFPLEKAETGWSGCERSTL